MKAKPQALYETRIVNFKVEPTVVKVGDPIKISGNLQKHGLIFGGWKGYEGQNVQLFIDGQKVDETTTAAEGYFVFSRILTAAGTYEIAVHYPGSWKDSSCWSPRVIVKVLSPQEYEKYEREQQTKMWLQYGALAIGLGAISLIGFEMYRMQRLEELALRRR